MGCEQMILPMPLTFVSSVISVRSSIPAVSNTMNSLMESMNYDIHLDEMRSIMVLQLAPLQGSSLTSCHLTSQ